MKRALFIDFEDSFTFNVVQELTEVGLSVEVLHWKDFSQNLNHDLLVLGPGPGHPDDYQTIFPLITEWQKSGNKIFAVCLGHQILWRILGLEVVRSKFPLHGQKIQLNLNPEWQSWLKLSGPVSVQRYNSLAVMEGEIPQGIQIHAENHEIMISRSANFISYQFHPESVGTKCRQSFFRPILRDLL